MSMFLYAYRAFIDGLAHSDTATLRKMTDQKLFASLMKNQEQLKSMNAEYFKVAKDIKMSM